MDFWGFDGRHREEIPGESFLFLDPPGAGPVGGPAANPPPPAPDPATEPAVRFGSGGVVEEGPRLTAADHALHGEYDSLTAQYRPYLTSADAGSIPRWDDFRTNPSALNTWFTAHREDMGRNGAPVGDLERRTGRLVTRGTDLKNLRTHIADPAHAPGDTDAARRDGIRTEADRVSGDILGAYGPGSGGGGGGGRGVGTASEGPGAAASLANGLDTATGIMARAGALGVTTGAAAAAWGGGRPGSSYGVNVADPYGSVGLGVGPGGGMAGVSSFGGVGGFGGGYDMSNTGFNIGMQSGEARNKSRMMEGMINQLLAAIMQGNLDAITSALTMCNLKAKTTMTQAATHVVRAMQLYDRQMRTISDQMGAIAGQSGTNNPNTGAQMGHLNSEMNQISMSRQAISNMLRDIMTMNEEISNQEKSFYDVKSREASLYRWS